MQVSGRLAIYNDFLCEKERSDCSSHSVVLAVMERSSKGEIDEAGDKDGERERGGGRGSKRIGRK